MKFSRGASENESAVYSSVTLNLESYVPLSLRKKPGANQEGKANTSIEPARLKNPVPLVTVDHVWSENVHYGAGDASHGSAKSCGMGSEA